MAVSVEDPAVSMDSRAPRLHLSYRHGPAALEGTRLAVLRFLAPHALSARTLYAIELVLEEWLTNVLRHGHDEPGQAQVDIELSVQPAELVLEFQDQGRAFRPDTAAAPPRARSLDEARPGGLGLAMIRHVASALHHERRGDRNVFTVTVPRR